MLVLIFKHLFIASDDDLFPVAAPSGGGWGAHSLLPSKALCPLPGPLHPFPSQKGKIAKNYQSIFINPLLFQLEVPSAEKGLKKFTICLCTACVRHSKREDFTKITKSCIRGVSLSNEIAAGKQSTKHVNALAHLEGRTSYIICQSLIPHTFHKVIHSSTLVSQTSFVSQTIQPALVSRLRFSYVGS